MASALVLTALGMAAALAGISWPRHIPSAPMPRHPFALEQNAEVTTRVVKPHTLTSNELWIPSIAVAAQVDSAAITRGSLSIPTNAAHVGQWNGGATMSSPFGTILIAGHVNFGLQGSGALARLAWVRRGDLLELSDRSGQVSSWRATALLTYRKSDLPKNLFSQTGPRRLVLVTCGGPFDRATHHYLFNVVVIAEPSTH